MQLSGAPPKIVEPFAVNAAPSGGHGGKRTIPVPSQIGINPGAASYNDGFPPLTMTPLPGGVVMSGLDMNGILNEATAIDNWMSAGASFQYDSVFSSAIGGYPKGARLLNAASTGFWTSIVDNNSTNPDTGGAGWIPDRATASVYASAQQTCLSGGTKVVWDTVEYDPLSQWDATNHRFKVLWGGKYRLSGSIYMPSPVGQSLTSLIYKNGSLARQCMTLFQVTDQQPISIQFDATISCAVNDYLEAFINANQASVLVGNASGNQPYVYGQIEFLGV